MRQNKGRSGLPKKRGLVRNRPVRRSQLISPFGVGAITDFRNDEALMCAGIDSWFDESPPVDLRVSEERLQQRLACEYFVLPPDFSENQIGPKRRIPYVRFPKWHYCPRCFRMQEVQLFSDQPFCTSCSEGKKGRGRRMIPIRIVAACEAGHLTDFPFREWIQCQCGDGAQLYFKSGRSSASIQGTKIECKACGRSSSLASAFQPWAIENKGVHCTGSKPWLGIDPGEGGCHKGLRTLLRGASNLYFPVVASSIYIPTVGGEVDPRIRRIIDDPAKWTALTANQIDGAPDSAAIRMIAPMLGVDAEELVTAVSTKLASVGQQRPVASTEEAFRRQEFDVLRAGSQDHRTDLFCETRDVSEYPSLAWFVRSVGLVRKLRETRVLTSFTRLHPPSGSPETEQSIFRAPRPSWLPAMVVRGEGIFIELQNDVVTEWAQKKQVQDRITPLLSRYETKRASRTLESRGVDARFILVHTFAHALIRELTFLCGYGSSALRERIYCNLQDHKNPMLGLLIYTASGDSEGTLGGLVSQADTGKLENLIGGALRRSEWCSNDPVCIESPAQGAGNENLAACHGCSLLPETSCEEGNRLLDRGLLVGSPDIPDLGFFNIQTHHS